MFRSRCRLLGGAGKKPAALKDDRRFARRLCRRRPKTTSENGAAEIALSHNSWRVAGFFIVFSALAFSEEPSSRKLPYLVAGGSGVRFVEVFSGTRAIEGPEEAQVIVSDSDGKKLFVVKLDPEVIRVSDAAFDAVGRLCWIESVGRAGDDPKLPLIRAQRVGVDGSLSWTRELCRGSGRHASKIAVFRDGRSVVSASSEAYQDVAGAKTDYSGSHVFGLSAAGEILWEWSPSKSKFLGQAVSRRVFDLAAGDDGATLAVGRDLVDAFSGPDACVLRKFDGNGVVIFERSVEYAGESVLLAFIDAAPGGTWVAAGTIDPYVGSGTQCVVLWLSSDGSTLATQRLGSPKDPEFPRPFFTDVMAIAPGLSLAVGSFRGRRMAALSSVTRLDEPLDDYTASFGLGQVSDAALLGRSGGFIRVRLIGRSDVNEPWEGEVWLSVP
jgi:hypothetical protein